MTSQSPLPSQKIPPTGRTTLRIDWGDFLRRLPGAPSLASVAWTVPAGLTEVSTSSDSTIAIIVVDSSGLTKGATYTLTCTATLSDSDIQQTELPLYVAPLGVQSVTLPAALSVSSGEGGDNGNSGTSDHGALTGLGDDDHPQYALSDGTRGSFEAAGAVAALQASLGTAATEDTEAFAPAAQGALAGTALQPGDPIPQGDVTGLTASLAAKADLVGGKVPSSQIPAIAISEYAGSVLDEAAMLALTQTVKGNAIGSGDFCSRQDRSTVWMLTDDDPSVLGNWLEYNAPASPVQSVNSQVGTVNLGAADVGAEPTITAGTSGQYRRGDKTWQVLNKAAVGLGNVPNLDATDPDNLEIAAEIIALLKAADRAAFRGLLGYSPGDIYGYQVFSKFDPQASPGVATGAAVSVVGWVNPDGSPATPVHTPLKIGDLVVARFTAGTVAHDENVVNIGIAVEIGGSMISGVASGSRTPVGSAGIIGVNSVENSLAASSTGRHVATAASPLSIAAKLINISATSNRTLYLNRTESDVDSGYAQRAISTLEVWGVSQ
ncbi:MAG: hypothetical protein ACFB0G_11185 [Leptolyngbyaceae cyanobacterium]